MPVGHLVPALATLGIPNDDDVEFRLVFYQLRQEGAAAGPGKFTFGLYLFTADDVDPPGPIAVIRMEVAAFIAHNSATLQAYFVNNVHRVFGRFRRTRLVKVNAMCYRLENW